MVSSCLRWTFSNCTVRKTCRRNRRRAARGSNRTSSRCSSRTKVSRPLHVLRTVMMSRVQFPRLLLRARGSRGSSACAYPASVKVPPLSRGCCTSSSSRKLRLFDTTSELRAASEITSCTTCSHRALCIRWSSPRWSWKRHTSSNASKSKHASKSYL